MIEQVLELRTILVGPFALTIVLAIAVYYLAVKVIPGLRADMRGAYAHGEAREEELRVEFEEKEGELRKKIAVKNEQIRSLTKQAAQWKTLATGKVSTTDTTGGSKPP